MYNETLLNTVSTISNLAIAGIAIHKFLKTYDSTTKSKVGCDGENVSFSFKASDIEFDIKIPVDKIIF